MACPFFMPTEKLENGAWPHPSRLPLGAGWQGYCTARNHEGTVPALDELQELCNLGYALSCPRLPKERAWDAIRFAIQRDGRRTIPGGTAKIQLRYVCEMAHRPADHGTLEFDVSLARWLNPHPDARLQRMAECFLESYLQKTAPAELGSIQAEPAAS